MSTKIQGTFNIGTAKETNINQLAKKLIQVSHIKTSIKHRLAIKGEQLKSCLNNNQARRELNWQPKYNLDKGLKETWQWFNKN